jgi:hypothetical protein
MFKQTIKLTLWVLILMGIGTGSGLLLLHYDHHTSNLHQALVRYWWAFAIWRYSLLGLLLWKWPSVCRWLGQRKGLSDNAIRSLIQRRWMFLGFIILFEIVVVYGV